MESVEVVVSLLAVKIAKDKLQPMETTETVEIVKTTALVAQAIVKEPVKEVVHVVQDYKYINMKNKFVIIPKIISSGAIVLLIIMPVLLKAQYRGQLLYESIYSYTGKGWQDDGRFMDTYNRSAFYAKIYENCLIETSGVPLPTDHYYTYIGNNKQNERIYQYNSFYFLVDRNYNLTRVIQTYDYRFGTNVKKYLYCEIQKGDLPKQTPEEIWQDYKGQSETWDMYRY